MDVRRVLNDNPKVSVAIAAVVIVLGVWTAISMSGSSSSGGAAGTYYTVDNGATYFRGGADELPPFQRDGKEAVRAYVFSCPDGKEFVAYLMKYSDEARQTLSSLNTARSKEEAPDMGKVQMAATRGKLVKRPEDKEWVSMSDGMRAGPVTRVKCPDGNPALPAE